MQKVGLNEGGRIEVGNTGFLWRTVAELIFHEGNSATSAKVRHGLQKSLAEVQLHNGQKRIIKSRGRMQQNRDKLFLSTPLPFRLQ